MAAKKKLNIRRSIERLLLPDLERRGFTRIQPGGNDNLMPYGPFVRDGARGVEQIELQFDKYQSSRFRLYLRIDAPGSRPGNYLRVPGYPEIWHLRAGLLLNIWFGVPRRKDGRSITEAEYDAVVAKVIALLPQIEAVFKSGRRTWYVRPGIGPILAIPLYMAFLVYVVPVLALLWVAGLIVRNL